MFRGQHISWQWIIAGKSLGNKVVVLHGGYWKNKFGLDDAYGNAGTKSLAPFFLARAMAWRFNRLF